MNFPLACCPFCRQVGYNVTSLDDEFFQYDCTNFDDTRTSKCGKFAGSRIPDWHKREGKEQISLLLGSIQKEV